VLAGIGGATVREAKERLLPSELAAWQKYRNEFGPLNVGQRIDAAAARIIFVNRAVAGNKDAKYSDFLPTYGVSPQQDDEPELTPEMFHTMFGDAE